MTNGAENSSSWLSRIYSLSLSLASKAEGSDKSIIDPTWGKKSSVSKIGERFQRS